jgi:undecaprenyl pyrophosphate phosphatase UppP
MLGLTEFFPISSTGHQILSRGFLPAVVLGVIFADKIHGYLFYPITVAMALVVGGIITIPGTSRSGSRLQP